MVLLLLLLHMCTSVVLEAVVVTRCWRHATNRSFTAPTQILLCAMMAAVAPLALDKDKDVRAAAVSTLQIMVARAVKEAEVTACDV